MATPSIAPIFLRLALAATFLWAGVGKLVQVPVQGDAAAKLANMGIALTPVSDSAKPAPIDVTKPPVVAPTTPAPAPKQVPIELLPPPSKPNNGKPATGGRPLPPLMALAADAPKDSKPAPAPAPVPARVYTAADFPNPVEVLGLYRIALLIESASNPASVDGKTPMALWPASLAKGQMPVYFAWAAAISEVLGGLFCLVGLMVRISAFFLAGTMATAMWLTQLGPAIQSGKALLGFLPNYGTWDVNAAGQPLYMMLLWQFGLLMACLALTCIGSGAVSLDRALFPPKGSAPKAPKPAAE